MHNPAKTLATAAICIAGAFGLVAAASKPARADVITTFGLQSMFSFEQFSGTTTVPAGSQLTIDTTTGTVTGQTIYTTGLPSSINVNQGYDTVAKSYFYNVFQYFSDYFIYFNVASLVNYAGGNLANLTDRTPGGNFSTYSAALEGSADLVTGSATAVSVPELASAGLLLGGLAAMTLLVMHRRKGSSISPAAH